MDVSINIDSTVVNYPHNSPFHPDKIYPELENLEYIHIDPSNRIYAMVRQLLIDLKLDEEKIGTKEWNPLSALIQQGEKVVIKPNLVLHHNKGNKNINAVVTHASIIRVIVDYVYIALKGTGKIIIGDAPHGDANFKIIVEQNGLKELVEWYKSIKIDIELIDFRKFIYPRGFDKSIFQEQKGDPLGYIQIDLGNKSLLNNLKGIDRLYGSDYNRNFIVQQHIDGHHKYLISRTIIDADVIISVPKLKTHKKTGITINLKNLVGINGNKNYLAHYRIGSPSKEGDQYPDTKNLLLKLSRFYESFSRDYLLAPNKLSLRYINRFLRIPFILIDHLYTSIFKKKIISSGNWSGNDTCWRMCLDLNYILRFSDKNGIIQENTQRKYFCIVDGIIAGEGDGPLTPNEKKCGCVIGGFDPYKVDYVSTYIMGFDPEKIPLIRESMKNSNYGFSSSKLLVFARKNNHLINYKNLNLNFNPHYAWIGKIER